MVDLGLGQGLEASSILELETILNTEGMGGVVFDYYDLTNFKFAGILPGNSQVVIGHYTTKKGWSYDASVNKTINSKTDHKLTVSLKGSTVSVSLDGQVVLGYVFNSVVVDGGFGLLCKSGTGSFDTVTVKTDDPAFRAQGEINLAASAASQDFTLKISSVTKSDLVPIGEEAEESRSLLFNDTSGGDDSQSPEPSTQETESALQADTTLQDEELPDTHGTSSADQTASIDEKENVTPPAGEVNSSSNTDAANDTCTDDNTASDSDGSTADTFDESDSASEQYPPQATSNVTDSNTGPVAETGKSKKDKK